MESGGEQAVNQRNSGKRGGSTADAGRWRAEHSRNIGPEIDGPSGALTADPRRCGSAVARLSCALVRTIHEAAGKCSETSTSMRFMPLYRFEQDVRLHFPAGAALVRRLRRYAGLRPEVLSGVGPHARLPGAMPRRRLGRSPSRAAFASLGRRRNGPTIPRPLPGRSLRAEQSTGLFRAPLLTLTPCARRKVLRDHPRPS